MKKNNNIWPIVIIIAILALSGVGVYAIYSKKATKAGYVSDSIFDVFTAGYDWYAENYGSDLVANGRNDKVASAVNGSTSSVGFESSFGI